jgi:hypothetical protein
MAQYPSRDCNNRHARNNRRAIGSDVLCVVRAEAVYNDDQLPLAFSPRRGWMNSSTVVALRVVGGDEKCT